MKQTSCSVLDLTPCYLSLFLRGTGLAATSLQDLPRVSEREGSVGSLGNSWLSQRTTKAAAAMQTREMKVSITLRFLPFESDRINWSQSCSNVLLKKGLCFYSYTLHG